MMSIDHGATERWKEWREHSPGLRVSCPADPQPALQDPLGRALVTLDLPPPYKPLRFAAGSVGCRCRGLEGSCQKSARLETLMFCSCSALPACLHALCASADGAEGYSPSGAAGAVGAASLCLCVHVQLSSRVAIRKGRWVWGAKETAASQDGPSYGHEVCLGIAAGRGGAWSWGVPSCCAFCGAGRSGDAGQVQVRRSREGER